MVMKVCVVCGAEFDAKSNAKSCDRCRAERISDEAVTPLSKFCVICLNVFTGIGSAFHNRRTCSDPCAIALRRYRQSYRHQERFISKAEGKACEKCGTPLGKYKQKYCSTKCKEIIRCERDCPLKVAARQRKWAAENKDKVRQYWRKRNEKRYGTDAYFAAKERDYEKRREERRRVAVVTAKYKAELAQDELLNFSPDPPSVAIQNPYPGFSQNLFQKRCAVCDFQFSTRSHTQITCSKECSRVRHLAMKHDRRHRLRALGVDFIP